MKTKLPRLDKIYLELSNICNFNCSFCPINISKRKKQYMDFFLLKKAVDEIAEEKLTDWIAFHILGEPLLYPRLTDAIKYVKSKHLKLIITTNGSLLTTKIVNTITELKIDKLSISIETPFEHEHASRGSGIEFNKYYKRILEALRIIKESKGKIEVVVSLMNTYSKKFFDMDVDVTLKNTETDFKSKLSTLVHDIYMSIGRDIAKEKISQSLAKIKCNQPRAIRIDEQIRIYIQMFYDFGNSFTTKRIYSI